MEPNRSTHSLKLSEHQLPGADAEVKRHALQSGGLRYQLLLQEATRIGWPTGFCDDLYRHDLEKLEASAGERMIWILRENGTHLYPVSCASDGEAAYYRRVIEYWSGDDKLNTAVSEADRAKYYFLSHDALTPITWHVAQAALRVEPEIVETARPQNEGAP